MRRDVALIVVIALAAFGIRTYPAWNAVFNSAGVSFLETDAWYHVRLVENQVRNYPWRVTADPFASPSAQFVPVAPLFDTITATVVRIMHGADATTRDAEVIAALMPPILGALTVVAVWALARRLFGARAGLLAASLLTVLPGHFMDRTMLGFVDHHALEALLAIGVLWGYTRASARGTRNAGIAAGVLLGLYLLAWGSGAFLVAIVGAWLVLLAIGGSDVDASRRTSVAVATSAVVALALVLLFQEPAMHRYGTQILGLLSVLALAFVLTAAFRMPLKISPRIAALIALGITGAVIFASLATLAPDVFRQTLVDIGRLSPDPARMGVLEARPLFLYSGNWDWLQPWRFFRTGIVVALIALMPFAVYVFRRQSSGGLLILIFALVTGVATVGQNRFGYYLVTACALLGGWLGQELLDWAGVPHRGDPRPVPRTRLPLAREIAVVAIAGGMFAPNLSPSLLLAPRTASFPIYWRDTMAWLHRHTPAPFAPKNDDYYFANYRTAGLVAPDYTILSWWDHGYWITQQAHRVPVANPTQERAPTAGAFYTATEESEALEIARGQKSRYVLSDFELPFRRTSQGTIMGRFQTIMDWTGKDHGDFYEVAYRREGGQWTPVWLFYEPYYRSMAFRLSALGGAAATPATTTVVLLADREDGNGFRFREVVAQQTFATYAEARLAADEAGPGAVITGLDPWRSAVPLEALESFVEVHAIRTPEQSPAETPWVRVFEVR